MRCSLGAHPWSCAALSLSITSCLTCIFFFLPHSSSFCSLLTTTTHHQEEDDLKFFLPMNVTHPASSRFAIAGHSMEEQTQHPRHRSTHSRTSQHIIQHTKRRHHEGEQYIDRTCVFLVVTLYSCAQLWKVGTTEANRDTTSRTSISFCGCGW